LDKDIKALLQRINSRLKYAHFGYIKEKLAEISTRFSTPVRVLDVGCGPGNLGLFCREVEKLEWYGLDLWSNELTQAQQVDSYAGLCQVNLVNGIPFRSDCFDVVICNEVLMYMPDSEMLLARFHEVLKESGRLIVYNPVSLTPNLAAGIKRIIRRWAQAKESIAWDCQTDWKKAVRATRINYYSYNTLVNEIVGCGFKIIDVNAFRIFRNRFRWFNKLENNVSYRQAVVSLASRFPRFASDIIVLASKASRL
jgi:ubiquinone/menaquinone biosynthesis C-methylase UbiE